MPWKSDQILLSLRIPHEGGWMRNWINLPHILGCENCRKRLNFKPESPHKTIIDPFDCLLIDDNLMVMFNYSIYVIGKHYYGVYLDAFPVYINI